MISCKNMDSNDGSSTSHISDDTEKLMYFGGLIVF